MSGEIIFIYKQFNNMELKTTMREYLNEYVNSYTNNYVILNSKNNKFILERMYGFLILRRQQYGLHKML